MSIGYDFDAQHEEGDERRIADTFDIISLELLEPRRSGSRAAVLRRQGKRSYEDRVYRNLGEYYLTKLRYHDAAKSYNTFIAQYPLHKRSPHFSMRVIEIYETGRFPQLVLDSKKAFASNYGLSAEYWRHFDVQQSPEVLSYLKNNLRDLANHYHAQYQDKAQAEQKAANFSEAARWYGQYIASFRTDAETPAINYQLADLQLENKDFAGAAREYERTAYDYTKHDKAAGAGYAAVYAHREYLKVVDEQNKLAARRDTVTSSLRFADAFPDHEHAATILGAAADDLYDMKDFAPALSAGRKLIERYPNAAAPVRRSAWLVVAHSSLELADYPNAEQAYGQVLALTAEEDESRPGLVENLAASIYKQGERANEQGDYRSAANNFLRIKQVAPTAKIRAAAEYDAGAALIGWKTGRRRPRCSTRSVRRSRITSCSARRRSRSRWSIARPASCRALPMSTSASPWSRRNPEMRSGSAAARGPVASGGVESGPRARRVPPLRRAVPEAGRDRASRRNPRSARSIRARTTRRATTTRWSRSCRSTQQRAASARRARASSRAVRRWCWRSRSTRPSRR